jgi:hypothetical protein
MFTIDFFKYLLFSKILLYILFIIPMMFAIKYIELNLNCFRQCLYKVNINNLISLLFNDDTHY